MYAFDLLLLACLDAKKEWVSVWVSERLRDWERDEKDRTCFNAKRSPLWLFAGRMTMMMLMWTTTTTGTAKVFRLSPLLLYQLLTVHFSLALSVLANKRKRSSRCMTCRKDAVCRLCIYFQWNISCRNLSHFVCVYHASMVLYETRSLNSLKLLFFSDIFALMKETLSAVEIAIWKGRKSITN